MYTVRRETSAAAAISLTEGSRPWASSDIVASTIVRRVRRRCAARPGDSSVVVIGLFSLDSFPVEAQHTSCAVIAQLCNQCTVDFQERYVRVRHHQLLRDLPSPAVARR